ncbi:MAG: ATP-binding protein, partial [Candidatus Sericytochromatia bacterium]|nr:ATP-binding protein [Candidatus Tanganyikabacteria bacterium]
LLAQNKLAVELELSSEPLEAELDEARISQVLANILGNAVKFSPPGATIRVHARKSDGYLLCEITDTGPGIADASLSKLFKPFSRLEASSHVGGTGLGLSICHAIVKAHHGEIGVRSEVGRGSTFWFSLPRVRATV